MAIFRAPSVCDPTRGAEGLLCSFQSRDLAVLRPIAAMPFVKFEAPEPRFARRVGTGLKDAPTYRPSKKTCSGRMRQHPARHLKPTAIVSAMHAQSMRLHRSSLGAGWSPCLRSRGLGLLFTCRRAHVWTAPAVQGKKSDNSAKRSGAAMYSAFECSRFGCWPCVIR